MKRERCLAYIENRERELIRQHSLISNIPRDKLLLITIRAYITRKWVWDNVDILCTVNTFNSMSIRFNILAVNNRETHPFNRFLDIGILYPTHAITFKNILEYREVPKEDLPLYLGWPLIYPALSDLLKG